MSKAYPLAEAVWLDHASIAGGSWQTIDDISALEPITIRSVGFLVKETDASITLVAHLTSEGGGAGEMCILKTDIVSRRKLK